jgi:hypothetical protein
LGSSWPAAVILDELGRRRFSAEDVDRLVAGVDRYKLEDATAAADAP